MDDNKGSYGKRPLWQWVLLYIIIGGLVYAGVYYFVYADRSGNGSVGDPAPEGADDGGLLY